MLIVCKFTLETTREWWQPNQQIKTVKEWHTIFTMLLIWKKWLTLMFKNTKLLPCKWLMIFIAEEKFLLLLEEPITTLSLFCSTTKPVFILKMIFLVVQNTRQHLNSSIYLLTKSLRKYFKTLSAKFLETINRESKISTFLLSRCSTYTSCLAKLTLRWRSICTLMTKGVLSTHFSSFSS